MVIQGYIDGSGNRNDQRYTLAGFVSSSKNWELFAADWANTLAQSPKIDYFKSSQSFALRDQFDGVSPEAAEKKRVLLACVAKKYALLAVSSICDQREYDRFLRGLFQGALDNPFSHCLYQIVYAVIVFQRRYHWDSQIEWYFDEEGQIGLGAISLWPIFKAIMPKASKPFLGSPPSFKNDEKLSPLQAADLFAGALRRFDIENRTLIVPPRPELKLLHEIHQIHRKIEPAKMQRYIFNLKQLHGKFICSVISFASLE